MQRFIVITVPAAGLYTAQLANKAEQLLHHFAQSWRRVDDRAVQPWKSARLRNYSEAEIVMSFLEEMTKLIMGCLNVNQKKQTAWGFIKEHQETLSDNHWNNCMSLLYPVSGGRLLLSSLSSLLVFFYSSSFIFTWKIQRPQFVSSFTVLTFINRTFSAVLSWNRTRVDGLMDG